LTFTPRDAKVGLREKGMAFTFGGVFGNVNASAGVGGAVPLGFGQPSSSAAGVGFGWSSGFGQPSSGHAGFGFAPSSSGGGGLGLGHQPSSAAGFGFGQPGGGGSGFGFGQSSNGGAGGFRSGWSSSGGGGLSGFGQPSGGAAGFGFGWSSSGGGAVPGFGQPSSAAGFGFGQPGGGGSGFGFGQSSNGGAGGFRSGWSSSGGGGLSGFGQPSGGAAGFGFGWSSSGGGALSGFGQPSSGHAGFGFASSSSGGGGLGLGHQPSSAAGFGVGLPGGSGGGFTFGQSSNGGFGRPPIGASGFGIAHPSNAGGGFGFAQFSSGGAQPPSGATGFGIAHSSSAGSGFGLGSVPQMTAGQFNAVAAVPWAPSALAGSTGNSGSVGGFSGQAQPFAQAGGPGQSSSQWVQPPAAVAASSAQPSYGNPAAAPTGPSQAQLDHLIHQIVASSQIASSPTQTSTLSGEDKHLLEVARRNPYGAQGGDVFLGSVLGPRPVHQRKGYTGLLTKPEPLSVQLARQERNIADIIDEPPPTPPVDRSQCDTPATVASPEVGTDEKPAVAPPQYRRDSRDSPSPFAPRSSSAQWKPVTPARYGRTHEVFHFKEEGYFIAPGHLQECRRGDLQNVRNLRVRREALSGEGMAIEVNFLEAVNLEELPAPLDECLQLDVESGDAAFYLNVPVPPPGQGLNVRCRVRMERVPSSLREEDLKASCRENGFTFISLKGGCYEFEMALPCPVDGTDEGASPAIQPVRG